MATGHISRHIPSSISSMYLAKYLRKSALPSRRWGARSFRVSAALLDKKILISDPIEQSCVDILKKEGYEVTQLKKVPSGKELMEMIKDYDGLIVRSGTQVTKEVIQAGKRLRVIARAGTGVDNINVDAATKLGKIVMNTPGGNTQSAAELTLSLLMALSRNIPNASASLKSGKWERKKFMGTELAGKTIGIIGLGQIGRRLASACQALGMRTIGYDPILSKSVAAEHGIELVSLDELYPVSDFISLHTPLTAETRGLFNDATFAKCKDGVRIVNCARGGIIDEMALLRAIESGKVAGAALDVFEPEPPPASLKPVLEHPAIICTPHLGASTEEAQERVAVEIAQQMVDAFAGRRMAGIVNSKILALMNERKGLGGFIDLSERLGSLQAQLLSGNLNKITLTTRGDLLKDSGEVLSAAALKGIMSHMVADQTVNYINAPGLATEFGVKITHVHDYSPTPYGSTIKISFHTDKTKREVTGTVLGDGKNLRIVKVDDYPLELAPEGNCIFFKNKDRPGLIARVCTLLGDNGINISNFALGRKEIGGTAVAVVGCDQPVPHHVLTALKAIPDVVDLHHTQLASLDTEASPIEGGKPLIRPSSPNFGSGPTAKFPGYKLSELPTRALGRSHRSSIGKSMLKGVIEKSKKILEIPKEYQVAIVPASDTGAYELAMWSLLGPRPVDVCQWESFGKGWETDVKQELKLKMRQFNADYGKIPDLSKTDPTHDICFTFNGTTSGVRVPNLDWISPQRQGLTLCDATSAVFSMELDWSKLDVTTYSWQKALGGEGAHGMLILSPRAIERLKTYDPPWPLPKLFRLKKGGKVQDDIFAGNVINTPSMLCVEDCLAALNWAESVGGLKGMVKRSQDNLRVLEEFVKENPWIKFLAEDPAIRSSTSVCFTLDLPKEKITQMTKLLADEEIAYDIGAYRSAPAGLRIWCGSTVNKSDIEALTHWLKWAYDEVRK